MKGANKIGDLYRRGGEGIDQDVVKACSYYILAQNIITDRSVLGQSGQSAESLDAEKRIKSLELSEDQRKTAEKNAISKKWIQEESKEEELKYYGFNITL